MVIFCFIIIDFRRRERQGNERSVPAEHVAMVALKREKKKKERKRNHDPPSKKTNRL